MPGGDLARSEGAGPGDDHLGNGETGTGTSTEKSAGRFPAATAGGQGRGSRSDGSGFGATDGTRNAEDIGADEGAGGFSAGTAAGQRLAARPGGTDSGTAKTTVNAEDIGAGAGGAGAGAGTGAGASPGADPADQPFSGGGPGTGGPGGGRRVTAGAPGGPDNLFPLPNFEPAAGEVRGSADPGPAGLLSGGGVAGVRQGASQATISSPGEGQSPPINSGQTGKGTSTATTGAGAGRESTAHGFDWSQAAKDDSQSQPGGTGTPGDDMAQGGEPADSEDPDWLKPPRQLRRMLVLDGP